MENEEKERNSFTESYHIQSTSLPHELPIISIVQSVTNGNLEAVEDYRLSEGKMMMLETFKQSINSLSQTETHQADDQKITQERNSQQTAMPKMNHCFQIKEESNQSEARSIKQQDNEHENKTVSNYHQHSASAQSHSKNKQNSLIPLSSFDSMRLSLTANINKAISLLCKGILLQKYCYKRQKIEKCVLCFSECFQFMSIYALEKKGIKVYSMKSFVKIQNGSKSQNFQRYIQNEYKIDENLCFSIIFNERSFDLVAKSAQERDSIVSEIKLLNQSS